MDPTKWETRFMDMAKLVSSWSKDQSTQVGAVLVNKDKIVVGLGYNGFPRGLSDSPSLYRDKDIKYKIILHAEVNAILNTNRGSEGSVLYIWPFAPCSRCASQIIQSKIIGVIFPCHEAGSQFDGAQERWADDIALASGMFAYAGVKVSSLSFENIL